MKKVILWDKSQLIVKDDIVPELERKLQGTAKFWLNHLNGRDLLDPKAVARVTQAVANQDYSPQVQADLSTPALEQGEQPEINPELARREGEGLHDWFNRVGKGYLCFCPKCFKKNKGRKNEQGNS